MPCSSVAKPPSRAASEATVPDAVAGNASVMYSACAAATVASAGSGVASVTNPAPPRSAACPHNIAAPVFPTDPATSSTCPYDPLCASAALCNGSSENSSGPAQRNFPFPTSSTSAAGVPISRTTSAPQLPASADTSCPIFGAVNVTVRCARKTGPCAASPSDGNPDGVSTATIHAGHAAFASCENRFTFSITCASKPLAPPRIPVPSNASTITSLEATPVQAFTHSASLRTSATSSPNRSQR